MLVLHPFAIFCLEPSSHRPSFLDHSSPHPTSPFDLVFLSASSSSLDTWPSLAGEICEDLLDEVIVLLSNDEVEGMKLEVLEGMPYGGVLLGRHHHQSFSMTQCFPPEQRTSILLPLYLRCNLFLHDEDIVINDT